MFQRSLWLPKSLTYYSGANGRHLALSLTLKTLNDSPGNVEAAYFWRQIFSCSQGFEFTCPNKNLSSAYQQFLTQDETRKAYSTRF